MTLPQRACRWTLASLAVLLTLDTARPTEFTFSSDSGAILKLQRTPDLTLNGNICAPARNGGCQNLTVSGVNRPGVLSLQIQDGIGGTNEIIEYDRVQAGKPKSLEGYTVWTTTSPNAPDYLRSFKAPVVKSDPLSDESLRAWNGDPSKLIDLQTFATSKSAFSEFAKDRGYPERSDQTAYIVTTRQDAASWEALSIREAGSVPDISTFKSGTEGAVVALDSQVIVASLGKEAELSPYVNLSAVDAPRGGTQVIDFNIFSISAPVSSIFDDYVAPEKRQSAASAMNDAMAKLIPTDGCKVLPGDASYMRIECVTHTSNYSKSKKADKIFVSCLFLLFIYEPVSGVRSIKVTQQVVGGPGSADQEPPPSDEFTIIPQSNPSVLNVQKQLRARLAQALSAAFPPIEVRQ